MACTMGQNKGKRAEREVVALLRAVVDKVYARLQKDAGSWKHPSGGTVMIGQPPLLQRNLMQAHRGGCDIHGLEWLAMEVKHQEANGVNDWWKQTLRQANSEQLPVLFYRRNNAPWKVRMPMMVQLGVVQFRPSNPQIHWVELSMEHFLEYFDQRLYDVAGRTAWEKAK